MTRCPGCDRPVSRIAARIPVPRAPGRPEQIPAAVWNAVHTTAHLPDTGRDTDGWQRCGKYEIRFDDDRRER